MTSQVRFAAMIGAFLVSSACQPAARRTPLPTESSPRDTDGRWGTIRVVEDLRIGSTDGPETLVFNRITFGAVNRNGTIFVSDASPGGGRVRSFRADGSFGHWIGRVDAPGEYRQVTGMKTLPDGRLAVYDVSSGRVSIFGDTGEYLSGFSVRTGGRWTDFHTFDVDLEGNLYVLGYIPAPLISTAGDTTRGFDAPIPTRLSGATETQSVYQVFSTSGQRIGTIPLPPPEPFPDHGPFVITTLYSWSPLGYLVVGRNDEYRIAVQSPGETVMLTRRGAPVRVIPLERRALEARQERFREMARRGGWTVGDYPPIPTAKPYFKDIRVGDKGRIWVHRHVRAEKRTGVSAPPIGTLALQRLSEPLTFDVFEPDGAFLGSVVLPPGIRRVLTFRDKTLWAVHTDEVGTNRLVRLRVRTQSR